MPRVRLSFRTWLITLGIGLWGASCTTSSSPRPPPPPPPVADIVPEWAESCPKDPGLCLDVRPIEAVLEVDGQKLGRVIDIAPDRFLSLDPGIHRITLTHPGYDPWRAEIAVEDGPEPIEVELIASTD